MPVSLCKIGKFFLPAMFGVVFLFPKAYACTCPPINSPKAEMKQAEAVFIGKVVKTNVPNRKLHINLRFPFVHFVHLAHWGTRIEFSVKEVWKGQASSEIGIMNPPGYHGCNLIFKEGDEYLVYAYGEREGMYTHKCTRTALLIDANEDLAELGKGIRPELPSVISALPPIGSLVLALALPVLILWIYYLKRGVEQKE
jgi:hypothetical protein